MAPEQRAFQPLVSLVGGSGAGATEYRRNSWRVWVAFGVLLLGLGAHGFLTLRRLDTVVREGVGNRLGEVRDAVGASTETWVRTQERAAVAVATSPRLQPVLLAAMTDENGPEIWPALSFVADDQMFDGLALVDAAGRVIESQRLGLDGGEALPSEIEHVLAAAQQGEALVSRPYLGSDGTVHMVVGAPVTNAEKKPIGAVLLGLHVTDFEGTLQAARAGDSGETYAVGPGGVVLSDSRFLGELRQMRLLAADDETAVLRLEARDPGGDLTAGYTTGVLRNEQPLTRAVEDALDGNTGVDVAGYRDYRGVWVVGAWTWLPRHGIAIITESDAEEALEPLYVLRRMFLSLLALVVAAVALAAIVAQSLQRQRRRAQQAEMKVARLGQYQLEEKLGEGGMGSVYRARHAMLRRPCAVKILSQAGDEEAQARFEREVRRTAELTHPNTIAIFDYGRTAEGVFYYAMELLDGIDLEDTINRFGAMPEGRAIHLLRQAASALVEAHDAGFIHRDIKPANLYLCRRGGEVDVIKVLDFGLVKSASDKNLTAKDIIMGTAHYLAPEQALRPNDVTTQVDIYALGAVAYDLITGQRVFDDDSPTAVVISHIKETPQSPSERLGQPIDPALEALVLRCLAKDPNDRPQGAREFIKALDACAAAGTWTASDAEAWWAEQFGGPGPKVMPKREKIDDPVTVAD